MSIQFQPLWWFSSVDSLGFRWSGFGGAGRLQDRGGTAAVTYPTHTHTLIYMCNTWQTQSILLFFDLKKIIFLIANVKKNVYRYFNLSSVNFFVARLEYGLFCSNGLWRRWSLYYWLLIILDDNAMCFLDSILLGWRFLGLVSFGLASPSIFFIIH